MRFAPVLCFILFFSQTVSAQHSDPSHDKQNLLAYQDTLITLGNRMVNDQAEAERYSANYQFIKTLVNTLKIPNSYNFSFDSLKTISIQTAPDKRFRLFTWFVLNNDGSYRYYGTIQMPDAGGKLKMFPLVDYTPAIKNPSDTLTTNEKWYGAQYYKIIPVTYNVQTPYYILLGWKGNTPKTTKKVIDVLYFKNDKAYFGMPVFDGDKNNLNKKRIIFEYSRQVSMLMNYSTKDGLIVFDHLAPPDPKMQGKFDMYGPDMSYDAYRLANGRWKFIEDAVVKNPPSNQDELFNDPKKPKAAPVRKF